MGTRIALLVLGAAAMAGALPPSRAPRLAGPTLVIASGNAFSPAAPDMGAHDYHIAQRLAETGEVTLYLTSMLAVSAEKPQPFTSLKTTDYNGVYAGASGSLQKLAVQDNASVDVGGEVRQGVLAIQELIDSKYVDYVGGETLFEARFYTPSRGIQGTDSYSGIFSAKGGALKIKALHYSSVNTPNFPFTDNEIGPVYGTQSNVTLTGLQLNAGGGYAVGISDPFVDPPNDRVVVNGTPLSGLPPGGTPGFKLNDAGKVAHLRSSGNPLRTTVFIDSAPVLSEGATIPGVGVIRRIMIGSRTGVGDIAFNNRGDLAVNAEVVDAATGLPEEMVVARGAGGQLAALRFPAGAAPRIGGYFALNDAGAIAINAGRGGLPGEGRPSLQIRLIDFAGGGSSVVTQYFMEDLFASVPSRPFYAALNNANSVAFTIQPLENNVATYFIGLAPPVDLDIDSDNDNGFDPPDESAAEDAVEVTGDPAVPGKKVPINHFDKDADGVVDFADGFGVGLKAIPEDVDNDYDKFVPLILKVPATTDMSRATVTFDYSGSDPAGVSLNNLQEYTPAPGILRIWKKDGFKKRDKRGLSDGGDYVKPGEAYPISKFSFQGVRTELFVEAVRDNPPWTTVGVTVKTDGTDASAQRDWVNVTPVDCPDKAPVKNGSVATNPTEWTFKWDVSPKDGLVITDVALRDRFMADRMSLPYVEIALGTTSFRVELAANSAGGGGQAGCHLADVRRHDLFDVFPAVVAVMATYVIDQIPGQPNKCVVVVQRYEFRQFDPNEAVEPSETVPDFFKLWKKPNRAARYKPIVTYSFHDVDPSTIKRVEIPQRFAFNPDRNAVNACLFLRDHDTIDGIPIDIFRNQNPMRSEGVVKAVINGQPGEMDNYHQTYADHVDLPVPPPGSPEAIHIHWRWGSFLSFPTGNPLIGRFSQSVDVAAVAPAAGEDHPYPSGWRNLVSFDPLCVLEDFVDPDGNIFTIAHPSVRPVFWYAGRVDEQDPVVDRPQNAFFKHGGFFAPRRPPGVRFAPTPAPAQEPHYHGRVGQPVTFTGEMTYVPADSPVNVAWAFGDEGVVSPHPLSDANALTAAHVYATPGTYTAQFYAEDADFGWMAVYATVTIDPVTTNGPPLAVAGPDRTVEQSSTAGAIVNLDGRLSSDPEGDPLTFAWTGPFGTAFGPTPALSLPLGLSRVTLSVSDGTSSSSDVVDVTVRDTVPPVFALVPPDVRVEQAGLAGTVVALSPPSATDVCDAAPTLDDDAPDVFPLGTTTVTWRAIDASGNIATATTRVTVVDTTPPVIVSLTATPSLLSPGVANPDLERRISRLRDRIRVEEALLARLESLPAHAGPAASILQGLIAALRARLERDQAELERLLSQGGQAQSVPVTIAVVASDVCDAAPVSRIDSVRNNQAGDVLTPATPSTSWGALTGSLSLTLEATANRIYTITVRTTDQSGNSSTADVTVTVPSAP